MALRFRRTRSSLSLALAILTACDAKWGDSAINSELDKDQVVGCYRSPSAEPMLRITETQIYAGSKPVYDQYVYAKLGRNNYSALVVRPKMAIAIKQDIPRIYSFMKYGRGGNGDFNYRVTDTSAGKVIHMHLDDGQHVGFVQVDCPS